MNSFMPGDPDRRLRNLGRTLIAVCVVFALQLFNFQVFQASALNEDLNNKLSTTVTIPALRGQILDVNGKVLARTVFVYDVNVAPDIVAPFTRTVDGVEQTVSVEQAAAEIAAILKLDPVEMLPKLIGTSKYANLKKAVNAHSYRKLQKLNIPWLFFDTLQSRTYPSGAVAGNLIGFIRKDGVPGAGLELTMNSCLAGTDGVQSYQTGVDGIKIPQSTQITTAAVDGSDVILTIDADLQYYAQQVVAKYVRSQRADWGAAVVVEAKTGRILAAAEAPTVDPNAFWEADAADRGSRIFQDSFEPGSTMKSVTAATAVDTGFANPSTQVKAPYSIRRVRETIQDSHMHGVDKLTLTGVLRDSSNTGIVQIGEKIPLKTRWEYLEKFGLGVKTAVGFEGEASGLFSNYKKWDGLTNFTSMFGQGVGVTPIQTAYLYQTIANKGVRLPASLVQGCRNESGTLVAPAVKQQPVRVISEQAARTTIDMLEKVVEQGGIGRTADVEGYRIAGKSGTAQIREGATYGRLHAVSFIGMAPADDPEYVLAVTVYKPRTVSNSLGATPIFKSIMQQILRMYRVPPSTTKSANIPTEW